MNRQLLYVSLLSAAIVACSSNDKRTADGGFEYMKVDEGKPLTMPEGLQTPKQETTYFITTDINTSGPVGKNMDIRAPSLVLPVATSTRLEPGSNDAVVWFDQEIDDVKLSDFVQQTIADMLIENNAQLTVVDAANHVYESSWINNESEEGGFFRSKIDSTSEKYRYSFDVKPHGRSLLLKVELVDYKANVLKGKLTPIDKHRAEVAMVNTVIGHVDYKYREIQREHRLMIANQKLLSTGFNDKQEPSFFVELQEDLLWQNLPLFFNDYGFTVNDLNETRRIYYVTFEKPEIGLWDTLWGSDTPIVEIENAKYQFRLYNTETPTKTALTIYNEAGEPVPMEVLEKIFPVVEPGLSFRNIF
ncbi:outer membrane protein assembly factor BamC [Thalassotalea sp. LPB0316]|uniref:outer membrane protein assembly factor BamC n=1 Tax=Thalassotalea sp. LPB0316 TaxID=2769490 RepID=UPI0018682E5D|nr:outer membrane protein assembly factor BamC [Thalassotalea sp. LPB0316]QOL25177.1 outer membrane protein assembly factor BamC [Thalassotalea sp. LPB0316]